MQGTPVEKMPAFGYDACVGGGVDEIAIPIATSSQYRVTQSALNHQFHNLYPGDFHRTFYDLSRAADQLADLELEDIKEFIHDEAAKGTEVFEILGMRFPAEQVTIWGIVLVLSVQLYLLTYLSQSFDKLGSDDPGWDIPWIGMNPSGLAKSMFLISIVPLPYLALAMLVTRRVAVAISPIWNVGNHTAVLIFKLLNRTQRAQILALLLAWILGLVLGVLSWKYRPQPKESAESCSPALFE